jgi:hypothetical protein
MSMLPPQLRQVIELRFDHQNPRDDLQVARLLDGSADEVREWTLMAFKRMRELDGLLPVPELQPDEFAAYRETVYRNRRAIQDREITAFRCDTQSRDSQAYDVAGGDRA